MSIRVGFIGLGNQGKPIAAHLAPAGFETTVYDIAEAPVRELVAGGARAAASPREVGERVGRDRDLRARRRARARGRVRRRRPARGHRSPAP